MSSGVEPTRCDYWKVVPFIIALTPVAIFLWFRDLTVRLCKAYIKEVEDDDFSLRN